MKFFLVVAIASALLFPADTPMPTEVIWIAKTICREFGGVDETQSLYCANVILNRVKSKRFPDTVQAVLEAPGQYGDYSTKTLDWPTWAKTKQAKKWRDRCLDIARRTYYGETVLPSDVLYQAEFKQGKGVYAKFKNFSGKGYVYFCYG